MSLNIGSDIDYVCDFDHIVWSVWVDQGGWCFLARWGGAGGRRVIKQNAMNDGSKDISHDTGSLQSSGAYPFFHGFSVGSWLGMSSKKFVVQEVPILCISYVVFVVVVAADFTAHRLSFMSPFQFGLCCLYPVISPKNVDLWLLEGGNPAIQPLSGGSGQYWNFFQLKTSEPVDMFQGFNKFFFMHTSS